MWNAVVPLGPNLGVNASLSARIYNSGLKLWTRLQLSRLGHYSTARIDRLNDYYENTSTFRAVVVCCAMPWPALMFELLIELIPLQDPAAGWKANTGAWVRLGLVMVFAAAGSLLQVRATTPGLSIRKMFAITVGTSVIGTAIILLISSQWVFPLPCGFIGAGAVWASVFVTCLLVSIRHENSQLVDDPLKKKIYLIVLQVVFVAIYNAFNIVFDRSATFARVGLLILLHLMKLSFRDVVAGFSSDDTDTVLAVVIFSVDVLHGLYCSICIQSTGSWWAAVMIIFLNGMHGTFLFTQISESAKSFKEQNRQRRSTRERSLTLLKSARLAASERESVQVFHYDSENLKSRKSQVLTSQILFQLEYRALVGYIEAVIPLLYTVHLAVLTHLPSAKYYPHTSSITPENLRTNVGSILAYASMEFVSLAWLQLTVKRKFGFSLLYQLGFVLESETELLQGRLFVWIVVLLQLTLVHFGMDFSFQFAWMHNGS